MRDQLAEQLLAKVMKWDSAEVATHMPLLQSMATYKYDDYQRFSPGMRFIESLALWLQQYEEHHERNTMFQFVRDRLILVSAAEMNHLVALTYPDHVRPRLLARVAGPTGIERWRLGAVAKSQVFRVVERRCLFLGLSDGARTDVFRRANPRLSHEQVRQTHELPADRVDSLVTDLHRDLTTLLGAEPRAGDSTFNTVVLLDDFSASGLSYFREAEDGRSKGKIAKFLHAIAEGSAYARLVDKQAHVIVALYMATSGAEMYLRDVCSRAFGSAGYQVSIVVVQSLPDSIRIVPGENPALDAIIQKYYDSSNETSSTALGKTDLRYGFAGGGLPLVLNHNTPNNSIGLLWADGPKMRALFPRVARHKDVG